MTKARQLLCSLLCLLLVGSLSAQYTVTTGTGSFIDISASGTPLNLTDDGESSIILPFDFTFFGVVSTAPIDLRVGNNGAVAYGTNTGDITTSAPTAGLSDLTGFGNPAQVIAPFWDDWDDEQGNVYWEVQGTAPNRVMIIQWEMRVPFSGTTNMDPVTFQLQMDETTHRVVFFYEDVETDDAAQNLGAAATIGMRGSGGVFTEFANNQAGAVSNGFSIVYDDPNDDIIITPPGVETVNLAAITEINITLNDGCMAMLVPSQILTGNFDVDGNGIRPADGAFSITVQQDNDPTNGPMIEGCGRYRWTVTADPAQIIGFTTAWGYVNAEDKTSPALQTVPTAPTELFCNEVDAINLNTLANNVSRCYMVNNLGAPLQANFTTTALGRKLVLGGGLPLFTDGCSDMQICVNDVVINAGSCNDLVIRRTFTARDGFTCTSVSGEANAPTVATYDIVFSTPSIASVQGVPATVQFSCVDFDITDPNPQPEADDFPFFIRGNGTTVFLGNSFCNLGASFTDGPRIVTCENTYKFVRTYTVVDWCQTNVVRTFSQVVKVGDFFAPEITLPTQDLNFDGVADSGPLFFSTNSTDCTSFFVIPSVGLTDSCDRTPTVTAVVYANNNLNNAPIGPFNVGAVAGGFPVGTHRLVYTATDDCDNSSTAFVLFTIADRTAPVAICEDGLNISIGGTGVAVLRATDIDGNSYDECSGVTLAIACVGPDNQPLPGQTYQPTLTLDCDDLGIKTVGLRVTDAQGNVNFCWLDILIEDKAAPLCIAPAPRTVTCADLDGTFPADLDASGLTADEISTLLNTQFGVANGVDNCPTTTITQNYADNRTSCGTGTIVRRFLVTDGVGLTSAPSLNSPQNLCRQTITILGVHDYTIVFPGDRENDNCITPTYNDVTFDERGCDLITVATDIDTFTATAAECFKLRITYEVLNWCEYNTENDAYFIPRDADNDNNLNEDTYLHILPRSISTLNDDLAILDRDNNPTNNTTIDELDTHDGGRLFGTNTNGYGTDPSRGAFIYQQFIKIYDDTAPVLNVDGSLTEFCDLDGDCFAPAVLTFTVSDLCSPTAVNATVTLDAFINAGPDNIYTLADFVADGGNVTANTTRANGTFTTRLNNLPIGTHAIRVVATDGCGNTAIDLIVFDVNDCKAPTPICINGLTATLMPDGNGGGMADIWAIDFIASPSTDCAGEVKYAMYRSATAAVPGFVPSVLNTSLDLTCADRGMLPVRIYAIDPNGNFDYCETTLFVQENQPGICPGSASGTIAGMISTPNNNNMNGVEVNISDDASMNNMNVTSNGLFTFTNLAVGADYTVQPSYDPSVNLAHVSTGDLITISRHILGIQEMTSEFQVLAADVTQDNNINVIDIIAIRRVILGLSNGFSATNSWRFYGENGQEVYNVNNLQGTITNANFAAVEMGDVNGDNAVGRNSLSLNIADQAIEAGNIYQVAVSSADMAGFQGTIELAAGLELVNVDFAGTNTAFNLENAANGLIAVSHVGAADAFTLELRATVNGQLSEMVTVSDRITAAQAYTTTGAAQNLSINFTAGAVIEAGFSVAQNTPNPFMESTMIAFELPVASEVSLTVQDVQGRVLMTRNIEGVAGQNTTVLTTAQLKGATGVLTYTIVAGDYASTKKMVVVQ